LLCFFSDFAGLSEAAGAVAAGPACPKFARQRKRRAGERGKHQDSDEAFHVRLLCEKGNARIGHISVTRIQLQGARNGFVACGDAVQLVTNGRKKLRIGIIGAGRVGTGLALVLRARAAAKSSR